MMDAIVLGQAVNLSDLTPQILMENFDRAVTNEKAATHLVLQYIHEVSERSLHLDLGYESIYKLLTHRHKYSSNQAYDRIDAARVLKANPQVIEKVQDGSLNLTQLIKVGQCIKYEEKAGREVTAEQTENIFNQIENQTIFETEKVLAVEMNFAPKKYQKVTPQSDGTVTALLVFTIEEYELVRKVQSLISHSLPNNDLAKAFAFLAKKHLAKTEGRTCAAGQTAEPEIAKTATQSFPDSRLKPQNGRKRHYISIKIRRQLLRDAKNKCEHHDADTGERCRSKFCLQVDHIIPLEHGGSDDIQNLRVLCGFHNRMRTGQSNFYRKTS